ncbi:Protein kinase domain-containing protein [Fusarium keratoplasticum]|uniref:Protein kinase domain-containing protein n=1 Tax=Fusarium keratoplasticum TaxID=1328300 RepID=A0ACC0QHB2_9HYPO|nr:Protein kinase domain-containing protein [Fusarium keratoplasticum]KAI8652725.1 Protein kinase domain-containing protein [Fusarium keratoplasticum]
MAEESDSNIWDSRFDDGTITTPVVAAGSVSRASTEAGDLLRDVMMIVRNGLPHVAHEYLRFDSHLGRGTSFEVSKEIYSNPIGEQPHFVAVKRLVMRRETDAPEESARELRAESRRLVNVKREVRVLTHPKLRSHPCLVSAIAWGWTPHTGGSKRPFLVMSYSMDGTLSHFAQNRSLNLIERRFLALDVAMGIRALHDCNIVHGDVKPDNVLVYDYATRLEEHERHYQAKLADFGSALFQEDPSQEQAVYLGTPKYNAPEIRGLQRDQDEDKHDGLIPLFKRFQAADCYSFGLLLWETINRGKSFTDTENPLEELETMFWDKENAILEKATTFFNGWKTTFEVLDKEESESRIGVFPSNPTRLEMQGLLNERRAHLDPIDAPPDEESLEVLKDTVSLCLQDSIWNRGNMHQIVEALAKGVSNLLPPGGSTTLKVLPRPREVNGSSPFLEPGYEKIRSITPDEGPYARLLRLEKTSEHLRVVPMDAPADPSLQVARLPPVKRVGTLVLTPQTHCYGPEDMFRACLNRQPPWENQCAAFEFLQHAIETEKDEERRAQAYLQLAIMYLIGYGVADDSLKAIQHLELASKHNEVARAILGRVRRALEPDEDQEYEGDEEPAHITYRNPDMFLDGAIERIGKADEQFLTLGPIKIQSFEIFSRLVKKGKKYEPPELSDAFTDACRDGHLDAAMLLAQHCTDIYTIDTEKPNPFHWLIMFSQEEAIKVLETVASSPTKETEKKFHLKAICSLLNAEHDMTVLLPHRCLELRGTPLHWAIMAGYEDLVKAFLRLGADVNKRTNSRTTQHQDGYREHHPSFSPLDIAAACHLPQIVKLLLDQGSEVYGGYFHWSFSPFHMLGYHTCPFARYMSHGRHYRAALRETIKALRGAGVDINGLDSKGETPLLVAVKNMDLEPYILEELLSSGATTGNMDDGKEGNIVTSAIMCCGHRRFSAWKIPLLLPLVRDINYFRPGPRSLNVLHYCAFFDAARAAEELLRWPQTDIGALNASGDMTAMSLAAQRGSLDVLALLIKNGADIEKGDAMASAICFGNIAAVKILLDAGAGIYFTLNTGTEMTILKYAVCRGSERPSYVRKCLALCPQLHKKDILDDQDDSGWTALHKATYFGDVEGVKALLSYGADPTKISAVDETPLDLATLTLQEFTDPESREYIRQTHPRIRRDIEALDAAADDFHDRVKRIQMGMVDRLDEIVELLREAELEQQAGGCVSRPKRKIVRKPRVGPFVDPEMPNLSRDEFLDLLYADTKNPE